MEIKDIQANQGNIDLVLEVVSKEEPRTFEKFGKQGTVCNAQVKDGSGEVKLTLWNDDVEKVNVGDKIHLQNGWCSEYKGEKQLSSGKFGKIEVLESRAAGSQEVFTNDPGLASGGPATEGAPGSGNDSSESSEGQPEEVVSPDEEFVE